MIDKQDNTLPSVVSISVKTNVKEHNLDFSELCSLGINKYCSKYDLTIEDYGGCGLDSNIKIDSLYINKQAITREDREQNITDVIDYCSFNNESFDLQVFNNQKSLRKDIVSSDYRIKDFSIKIKPESTIYIHFFKFN